MDITQELRSKAVELDDPLLHRAAAEIARLRSALETCDKHRWSPLIIQQICLQELKR